MHRKGMQPPQRFAGASLSNYAPQSSSQVAALETARQAVTAIRSRRRTYRERLSRWLGLRQKKGYNGLYFVGPVGTGKTHLLASMYHALHPEVPCAYVHASQLFRMRTPPRDFAKELAAQFRVLCLDEMEIDDPANEVRLVQVLQTLEARRVTLLATSNVKPEDYLSARVGNHRFQRFLQEEFQERYKTVPVGGADYRHRLKSTGRAWIGPPEATRPAMQAAFQEDDHHEKSWWSFDELMQAATHTEHTKLVRQLEDQDSLYLADVALQDSDNALRLLRLIDELYMLSDPPTLYFTSEQPPSSWLERQKAGAGLAKGVADKFSRTASRLNALCEIEHVTLHEYR